MPAPTKGWVLASPVLDLDREGTSLLEKKVPKYITRKGTRELSRNLGGHLDFFPHQRSRSETPHFST
jgi:hypothetical protein